MNIILLHPKATPEHLGLIPSMLDEKDPRPAREQFNEGYQHGGGWRVMGNGKLKMNKYYELLYPGDPPQKPIALIEFRRETIAVYESEIVAIIQGDGSFEACRMD